MRSQVLRWAKSEKRMKIATVTAAALFVMGLFYLFGDSKAMARSKADLYAVIVGVTKFQDRSIRPLTLATKDASDFRAFIEERKKLFGQTYITMLLDEQATRANITEALREKLKKAQKNDVVILYFSGHGVADAEHPGEFYFVTHDAQVKNMFGTALMMNDPRLFRAIGSDRLLLITDACHAAGFIPGIKKISSKAAVPRFAVFESLQGRKALSSSRGDELSYEEDRFGNSIFTHFLLKGLRGQADVQTRDGRITIEELYEYVYENTKAATEGKQNPQLYPTTSEIDTTPIFETPTFADTLNVDVNFEYVDENNMIRPLTENATLRCGDFVGVSFQPEQDCFVYILWWDSSGQVGRLFPNPELTEGDAKVQGGKRYWLPIQNKDRPQDRWFVLDDKPGRETIYFVASRTRNTKLEKLYGELCRMEDAGRRSDRGKSLSKEMERTINLMGFAPHTGVRKKTVAAKRTDREEVFDNFKDKIEVIGADLVYKITFGHVPREGGLGQVSQNTAR